MNRFLLLFISLFLIQNNLWALDAIDHNQQYIYVMDKGQVNRYTLGVYEAKGQYTIGTDSNFINRFYNDFAKPFCKDKGTIQKKLGSAFYTNLTCFNNKVFIAAQYASFTPDISTFEFVISEYNAEMQFQNCYVLKSGSVSRIGGLNLYPRFKMQYSNHNEVLLSVINPTATKYNDSAYTLANFTMDVKRCELRFKNLVATPTTAPAITGVCMFNSPKPALCFPVPIPLNYSQHPITFSFPYLIFRNWNKHRLFDPFHHFQYAYDSLRRMSLNIGLVSTGTFYNYLRTHELLLAYQFENDTLKMILRNYGSKDQQLVVVKMVKDTYTATNLKTPNNDFDDAYYHFINNKIVEVRKYSEGFDLKEVE